MRSVRFLWTGVLLAGTVLGSLEARAQGDGPVVDSASVRERDLLDVIEQLFPRIRFKNHTPQAVEQGQKQVVVLPQIGYTPQTRLLAQVPVNIAYRKPSANFSALTTSLTYTQNRQLILLALANLWSTDNAWVWVSDWRLMQYPQSTYGLGTRTAQADEIRMTYEYLRLYQTAYRRLARHVYAGLGYGLDLRWNIRSSNAAGAVERISGYPYGVQGRSVSAGPQGGLLFDNRVNAINPQRGLYASALLRTDLRAFGSQRNSQRLLVDVRTYWPTSRRLDNVLAFWAYGQLTLGGNPPYLDLPSTGWDTFSGLGRGYVQGRYRGRNLVYVETEYRFALRRDRLLGGVLFANAQSFAEPETNRFAALAPAAGLGLRLRLNKFSRVNLAVDYGWGLGGSQGLYFNVGEIF